MKLSLRRLSPVLVLALLGPATGAVAAAPAPSSLKGVTLDRPSFNPSLGETVTLSYELARDDRVWVRIYDPDGGLVRTLVDGEEREKGARRETWDGRDLAEKVVPNEAYLFTLETTSGSVYDPTTLSGGEVGDLTDVDFDRQAGTVNYHLPAPSRVLIRLGVANGPMLKTLVDWRPRTAGTVTEYWDGRDQDGLMDLQDKPGFTALVTYVTLPDATVIAYGNDAEGYRDYKLARGNDRPQKPHREPSPEVAAHLRPEGLVPPAWARAPRITMEFPKAPRGEGDLPEIAKATPVRIEVDPADRDLLVADQFEVIFFVDNVFFAEAERGYLPYNWSWEVGQLPPGEHLFTVNVSSFKGQVGVASRKVRVVSE